MSDELKPRPMTADDRGRLELTVDELTWTWARTLAGLGEEEAPLAPYDPDHGDERTQAVRLARLRVLKQLARHADLLTEQDALSLLDHGADVDDLAEALGVTRQAVTKRFGHVRQGDSVAVLISRRDRVREYADDPRGRVGEVGGTEQYDSDRGIWPVGKRVRAEARYVIVAVDGTVRRVYEIAPDSWDEVEPRLWQFEAVNGRELTAEEIDAAYQAGRLPLKPGADCPTRAGGAYRPHWF
ncbi:hypothetical protein [Streptomyces sp. MW-W600-10]|uniref:hypothetical protein n=1 Tax=Streptomyces sp. MW-W600-10 TaxID=2829819 RepID=UPI001C445479|nr:hypothetical protein [Streptomyces sp. MW-W600-10]MBV7249293.1 hypothetical protein [Streptomyces sp. MW-W600-10]